MEVLDAIEEGTDRSQILQLESLCQGKLYDLMPMVVGTRSYSRTSFRRLRHLRQSGKRDSRLFLRPIAVGLFSLFYLR